MAAFEQIGIASYTAVLTNLTPGASYTWTVNGSARGAVVIPRPPSEGSLRVQIQFETIIAGSDAVSINVVGGAHEPIEAVIIVPHGERQRLIA